MNSYVEVISMPNLYDDDVEVFKLTWKHNMLASKSNAEIMRLEALNPGKKYVTGLPVQAAGPRGRCPNETELFDLGFVGIYLEEKLVNPG
jgi:hypothetical protein